jgi:hypothetical protein
VRGREGRGGRKHRHSDRLGHKHKAVKYGRKPEAAIMMASVTVTGPPSDTDARPQPKANGDGDGDRETE